MIAVLYTNGEMELEELRKECPDNKWSPILGICENEEITIPLFHDLKTCRTFINRNLPKDVVKGSIVLNDIDLAWIKEQNWNVKFMSYPNKLDSNSFQIQIIYFDEHPEFVSR